MFLDYVENGNYLEYDDSNKGEYSIFIKIKLNKSCSQNLKLSSMD